MHIIYNKSSNAHDLFSVMDTSHKCIRNLYIIWCRIKLGSVSSLNNKISVYVIAGNMKSLIIR